MTTEIENRTLPRLTVLETDIGQVSSNQQIGHERISTTFPFQIKGRIKKTVTVEVRLNDRLFIGVFLHIDWKPPRLFYFVFACGIVNVMYLAPRTINTNTQ